MMIRARTDLWKDKDNNEIEPLVKQRVNTNELVAIENIEFLKDISIKCSAFRAEERPKFAQLNIELQKQFEKFANAFRKLNRGDVYEEYSDE